jgi:hypothetical protein
MSKHQILEEVLMFSTSVVFMGVVLLSLTAA